MSRSINIEERRRRRRTEVSPPLLREGFRPFFLLGAIWAVVALGLWLGFLAGLIDRLSAMDPIAWHQHEMMFGFASAIITGFLLTAIPNWTGRLPVRGWPLAGLAALWIAGRLALLSSDAIGHPLAAVIDSAFLVVLAGLVAREILCSSNWRNLPPAVVIGLLAVANGLFHIEDQDLLALDGLGIRFGIAGAAMLIGLIGGRIIPSFTRNWLAKRQTSPRQPLPLPSPFGWFDRLALVLLAAALIGWVIAPDSRMSGVLLASAGLIHLLRLARWCGWRTVVEPLVAILHIGYAWLAIGLWLLGMANLLPAFSGFAALHALTAGAFGTMMLAVMTRATLGHTGRALIAQGPTLVIYAAVVTGGMLRVVSPFFPDQSWLFAAGLLWAGVFLLFGIVYGPMLISGKAASTKA